MHIPVRCTISVGPLRPQERLAQALERLNDWLSAQAAPPMPPAPRGRRLSDELYDPATLARELGMSEKTLAKWRTERTGPVFVKIGGSPQYLRSDVEKWVLQRRRRA